MSEWEVDELCDKQINRPVVISVRRCEGGVQCSKYLQIVRTGVVTVRSVVAQ